MLRPLKSALKKQVGKQHLSTNEHIKCILPCVLMLIAVHIASKVMLKAVVFSCEGMLIAIYFTQ